MQRDGGGAILNDESNTTATAEVDESASEPCPRRMPRRSDDYIENCLQRSRNINFTITADSMTTVLPLDGGMSSAKGVYEKETKGRSSPYLGLEIDRHNSIKISNKLLYFSPHSFYHFLTVTCAIANNKMYASTCIVEYF